MAREETRAERLVYGWCFVAVYAGALIGLGLLWRDGGSGAVAELGGLALTSLLVFGKFIVFAHLHGDTSLGPWILALMVWLIDLLIAFALCSGLEQFEELRVIGGWLRRARARAVAVLREYPRLERMAFFGVVTFVLLPLAATGAVSGAFAARLLGLSRLGGVTAIALGSAGTAATFALLATWLGERGEDLLHSPVLSAFMLGAMGLFALLAYRRVKRILRKG